MWVLGSWLVVRCKKFNVSSFRHFWISQYCDFQQEVKIIAISIFLRIFSYRKFAIRDTFQKMLTYQVKNAFGKIFSVSQYCDTRF